MTDQIRQRNIKQMTTLLKSRLKRDKVNLKNLKFLYYQSYKAGDIEQFGWESNVSVYLFENAGIIYLIDPVQINSISTGCMVSQLDYTTIKL